MDVIGICSSTTLLLRLHSRETAEHARPEQRTPVPVLEETGFDSIFDGKTLSGWDGNPEFWSVKDGPLLVSPPKNISRSRTRSVFGKAGSRGISRLKQNTGS